MQYPTLCLSPIWYTATPPAGYHQHYVTNQRGVVGFGFDKVQGLHLDRISDVSVTRLWFHRILGSRTLMLKDIATLAVIMLALKTLFELLSLRRAGVHQMTAANGESVQLRNDIHDAQSHTGAIDG